MKRFLSLALSFIFMTVLLSTVTPQTALAAPNLNSASEWARDSITAAVEKGFVPDDIQRNFTNVITRQEFCRMAIKWVEYATDRDIDFILSSRGLARNPNAFSDTNDPDILAAFVLGITNGTGNGQFTPNGQFSREQAAGMIMNTCKVIGASVNNLPTSDFTDLYTASSWAIDGINFARANGIMQGVGGGRFDPKASYTREQSIMTFNNISLERVGIAVDWDDDWTQENNLKMYDDDWVYEEFDG